MTENETEKARRDTEPAWLAAALRPITEVRQGEAITVLLLTANVFLMLSAYYAIKPVREALILAMASGAEYKAYMSGVIALLLFLIVPPYGKLVDSVSRIKLVIGVSLGFAAQLALLFLAMRSPNLHDQLGLIFYAWVGVFNVMLVAQFWGYANDLYDKEQGARLFPLIALGASVGAAAGSKLAEQLIKRLGIEPMPLVAGLLLCVCASLFWLVERREGASKPAPAPPPSRDHAPDENPIGGFGLVLRYRYLTLIALFSLVYNWVNSNGEYMLGKLIKAEAAAAVAHGQISKNHVGDMIGAAYADFFFYVNLAAVLLQMFVVSRLVKWLKLNKAFLFLPVLALGNAAIVIFLPLGALFKLGKLAENATDYSLNGTLRQMLWLVTTPQMKFKAKQVVDTFCVRIGDLCSAGTVWLLVTRLEWSLHGFAAVSLVLSGVWLALALSIGRRFQELEQQEDKLGA